MESRYALGLLKNALGLAAAFGCFETGRVDAYASMLLAVLNEMAMLIARAEDRGPSIVVARDAVEQLISRLIGVDKDAPWHSRAS
jgi:hypothetical protein